MLGPCYNMDQFWSILKKMASILSPLRFKNNIQGNHDHLPSWPKIE